MRSSPAPGQGGPVLPAGLLPPTLLFRGSRNMDVKFIRKPELRGKDDGREGQWAGAQDACLPAPASAASLAGLLAPLGYSVEARSRPWSPGV